MPLDICIPEQTESRRSQTLSIGLWLAVVLAIAAITFGNQSAVGPNFVGSSAPGVQDWHGNVMRSHWER